MSDLERGMPDLDRDLRELRVEWPETPDVAAAVRARLAAAPTPRRRRRLRPALAYALAAIAAAAAIGLAASPSARSDILEFLGLKSVEIERREPRVATGPADLDLGRRLSLAEARREAGFPVQVPDLPPLGEPDTVYFDAGPGRVSLVYGARPGIPTARETRAGLLVAEMRATVGPLIQKTLGEGTRLERFDVDGDPAYFISGRVHGFAYEDENDTPHFEEPRLAGNVLLVERDKLLLRVEGRVTRDQAVRIVRSMR
jgi:hypothetical protein